jgi:hypothetical protein
MLRKILILGRKLPCTVQDLHKIIEHDWMHKFQVMNFLVLK